MAWKGVDRAETEIGKLVAGIPSLPKAGRELLVQLLPLLVGLVALISLWGAFALFSTARETVELQRWLYTYAVDVGPSSFERFMLYVAGLTTLFIAFMLGWAVPKLLNRTREGWRIVFAAGLLSMLLTILSLLLYGYGFSDFVLGLIGVVVGFYLLFQTKSGYHGKDGARRRPAPAPKPAPDIDEPKE